MKQCYIAYVHITNIVHELAGIVVCGVHASYCILFFLLSLLFCLSDQLLLNLLGDLIILARADVHVVWGVCVYMERGLKGIETLLPNSKHPIRNSQ